MTSRLLKSDEVGGVRGAAATAAATNLGLDLHSTLRCRESRKCEPDVNRFEAWPRVSQRSDEIAAGVAATAAANLGLDLHGILRRSEWMRKTEN